MVHLLREQDIVTTPMTKERVLEILGEVHLAIENVKDSTEELNKDSTEDARKIGKKIDTKLDDLLAMVEHIYGYVS